MKATLLAMTRFLALSGLSFGMNLGLTVLFHEVLNLSQEASLATAMVLVSVMNFIGCRYFVFETSDAGLAKQRLDEADKHWIVDPDDDPHRRSLKVREPKP